MSTRAASNQQCKSGTKDQPPSKACGCSGRAKKTTNEDKEGTAVTDPKGAAFRIMWNDQRTECLVSWLEDNIGDRQRLFSDSAQDAKEEHHRPRVAKSRKIIYHIKIAECIFAVDESAKIRDDLKKYGAAKFAKPVENRIAS